MTYYSINVNFIQNTTLKRKHDLASDKPSEKKKDQ